LSPLSRKKEETSQSLQWTLSSEKSRQNSFGSKSQSNACSHKKNSYVSIWKQSKDSKESSKLNNISFAASIVDQGSSTSHSYSQQYNLKKLKKLAAVSIIQKWFRKCRERRLSKTGAKQEWVGIRSPKYVSRNQESLRRSDKKEKVLTSSKKKENEYVGIHIPI